jgi:Fic family protein
MQRLLIDLAFNSSRLEGNTYSLLDTERLLELGQVAQGKANQETQMILNHKDAIDFLVSDAEEIGFNRHTILNLHALLSNNMLSNPAAVGSLRMIGVGISGSVYKPLEIPSVIGEVFDQILHTASMIEDPFEQAFFALVHIPYLQAFEDVNKRVSRLAANIPLIKGNLRPLSFVDVPNELYTSGMLAIYELNRIDILKELFIWAYTRSARQYAAVRQTLGEPDAFRLLYRDRMREIVSEIIRDSLDKAAAVDHLRQWAAAKIPVADREQFVRTVETELASLHEGNFVRYRVRPSEFRAWKVAWG